MTTPLKQKFYLKVCRKKRILFGRPFIQVKGNKAVNNIGDP